MDCQRIRRDELIESYLSHRLDEALSDEVETHVLGCPECCGLLEELQGVRDGLEASAASIRTTVTKPSVFRFWRHIATVGFAAGLTVILVVSFSLFQLRKAPRHDAEPGLGSKSPPEPAEKMEEQPGPVQSAGKSPTKLPHPSKLPSDARGAVLLPPSKETIITASTEPNRGAPSAGASSSASEDPKPKETGSSPSGLPAVGESPAAFSKSTVPEASTDLARAKLTSAQGVELFQIGAVEAAPFAFSGFGRHTRDPKGGKSDSLSERAGTPDTGRVLFQKGMTAYVEGRYDDAIGFLQSAAQREKKTDDINFYLGVSQILAGHPQEAAIPLGKVIALGKSAYLQSAHYYLGKACVQQVKLNQAESEFREAAVLPGRVTADSKALLARIVALRAQLEAK